MKNWQMVTIFSLIVLSSMIVIPNALGSIMSANPKNEPSNSDLLTLNNTSLNPLIWINSAGKLFAKNGADFNNSTTFYDSGKFCIRNPASTFTTCLTNSAVVANRTLTWPLITGTDTLATLGLSNIFIQNQAITKANPILTLTDTGSGRALSILSENSGNENYLSYTNGFRLFNGAYGLVLDSNNHLSILATKKLYLDGNGLNGGVNTYLQNPSTNVVTATVGGTQTLNSTNTTFQFKFYSAATDPTTSTLASGYCTAAKNTGSGTIKMFCNDGGTMKTVALS